MIGNAKRAYEPPRRQPGGQRRALRARMASLLVHLLGTKSRCREHAIERLGPEDLADPPLTSGQVRRVESSLAADH